MTTKTPPLALAGASPRCFASGGVFYWFGHGGNMVVMMSFDNPSDDHKCLLDEKMFDSASGFRR
jgi:hypothetical protein